jgi:hypothetical protein
MPADMDGTAVRCARYRARSALSPGGKDHAEEIPGRRRGPFQLASHAHVASVGPSRGTGVHRRRCPVSCVGSTSVTNRSEVADRLAAADLGDLPQPGMWVFMRSTESERAVTRW